MKKFIYVIALIFLFNSCTDGFEEMNQNPNNPETVTEDLLLPTVMFELSNIMSNQVHIFTDVVAQYAADYEFNDLDIYRWQGDDRFWSPMYKVLQNIKDVKIIAEVNKNDNYKAVSLILESYIYSVITDSYGDAPMSEANRTQEGITSPKYDSQQEIYQAILDKLIEANNIINTDETISGDLLYNGDMLKWKKFANSLRLRLLLHISGKQDVSSDMQTILNDTSTYPVFDSNDDNAIYNYTGVYPDISGVSKDGGGRAYDYYRRIPTTHFIDLLKDNDSRLELWVSPRECDAGGANCVSDRLQGALPGQSVSDIGRPNNYSRRSVAFFEDPTKIQAIFMTYSELNFILAEARQSGLINTGTAKAYYDTAVEASFNQWGAQMPSNFLTTTAPYNATNEVLYEQKWLALYHTGIESWLDWKRTGKPSFIQAGPANINGDKVPVRLLYPSLEQSVNSANYQAASSAMGGDDINSSSWWW